MKKTISLLLALVLCLSLCACGSNKAENPTTIPTEVIESTASKYADHPLLSQLYGTWEFESFGAPWEYTLFKSLTVNEDGSCIVDGTAGSWKISEDGTNETEVRILLYIDSECVYTVRFGESGDGEGNTHYFLQTSEANGPILPTNFIKK